MTIKHSHKYFENEAVIIRNFSDTVSVDEIIASWEKLIKKGELNSKVKGVVNYITDCNLQMDMHNFNKLTSFLKENVLLSNIKLAVVCDNPNTIIFPMLGQLDHELKIKPFTTSTAAFHWILSE